MSRFPQNSASDGLVFGDVPVDGALRRQNKPAQAERVRLPPVDCVIMIAQRLPRVHALRTLRTGHPERFHH